MRIFLLLICIAFCFTSLAQERASHAKVTLKDKNEVSGEVLVLNDSLLVMQSENVGKLSIQRSQIERIEFYDPDDSTRENFKATMPAYYSFTPSPFPLEKGQFYYRNFQILQNSGIYGISDNLNAELGLFLVAPVVFLGTNATFPLSEQLHFGVSANSYFSLINEAEGGLAYFTGRFGIGEGAKNFSFGMGYGTEFSSGSNGIVWLISGVLPVSSTLQLMTDHVIFPGLVLGTLGVRHNKNKFALDAGLLYLNFTLFDKNITLPSIYIGASAKL